MATLVEEYGLFVVSTIVFIALMGTLQYFTHELNNTSKIFIANLTGVSITDVNTYGG